MSTTLNFKDIIDLPEWRPLSPALSNATAGTALMCDLRNSEVREPYIYSLGSAVLLSKYNIKNDEWMALVSPALGGTFAVGAGGVFVPSGGPYGVLTGTHTTSYITIGTALSAAVGINQLANRGDGIGYKIRIIGNSAGGSGKIEERTITNNTSGTTPIIYLDSPLSFTPQNNDSYEFLSGALILFSAGALAATIIKKYDIATTNGSNVTNTNFIATIATEMTIFAMDEQYVPYDMEPGEGFLGSLTATGSGATSLTGQVADGDAAVLGNEYRNFQVRIIEDISIPTAVGQRRKVTAHTAGPSPVYTVAAWTVTPSVDAKFVIEYNNDILAWSGATTVTYSYLAGFNATAAWSTAAVAGGATQYANPPAAHAIGAMVFPSFGMRPSAQKLTRHSYFQYFRGAAGTVLDQFDIAGGATGLWSANTVYNDSGFLSTTGSSAIYDGATNEGKYGYLSCNGTQRFARFDIKSRCFEPWAYMRFPQSTVSGGQKVAMTTFIDGETKLGFLLTQTQAGAFFLSVALQR
jgi:hypothetical protein